MILTGGAPGKRMALPNSRILIHQPSGGFEGQSSDIEIHARGIRLDIFAFEFKRDFGRLTEFVVPLWVILLSHAAIAFGTLFGGWRIVKTMGAKITKLQPFGGFCAETAGALTLVGATIAGIPVSTTHTITGAIIGVGSTRRLSAVKWGVAGRIVWAWVLTIPIAAVVAAFAYHVIRTFQG